MKASSSEAPRRKAQHFTAQKELNTDFSKLSSRGGELGLQMHFPPNSCHVQVGFYKILISDLPRKSSAGCGRFLFLLDVQTVTPEGGVGPKTSSTPKISMVLTPVIWGHSNLWPPAPLCKEICMCLKSFLSPFISSVSAKHNQAVIPFLLNLLLWHFKFSPPSLCLSHLYISVTYLRRKKSELCLTTPFCLLPVNIKVVENEKLWQ